MVRLFYIGFILLLCGCLLVLNVHLYHHTGFPQPDPDVITQLNFLEGSLKSGAAEQMQEAFPEGYVFTNVLYGLAWTETGVAFPADSFLYHRALTEARSALQRINSPAGTAIFAKNTNPTYGIFHAGWSTWLQGNILALQHGQYTDAAEVTQFQERCEEIARAFRTSTTPFLCSYPKSAWPADNIVAMASLRLHDRLFTPRYDSLITHWLQEVQHRTDSSTGLIPHSVIAETGLLREGARGSSQTLMLRFLVFIDEKFAREQYTLFRQKFVTTWCGLPLIREYPSGSVGRGDVDSGPLLFGISPSASVVGLGTARIFGDGEFATALGQTHEMLGVPFSWNGEKMYAFGLLPVGDAFLAWSKATTPVRYHNVYKAPMHWWWRFPVHGLSVLVVAICLLPIYARRRRQQSKFSFRNRF